jgi:hypothetical protein
MRASLMPYNILSDLLTSSSKRYINELQGGSNMTGTNTACLHTNQSRSYLNHLVLALVSLYVAPMLFGSCSQPSSRSTSCNHWHITAQYILVSALRGCIADIMHTSNGQLHCLELCCIVICWSKHGHYFHMRCHSLKCHYYYAVGVLRNM